MNYYYHFNIVLLKFTLNLNEIVAFRAGQRDSRPAAPRPQRAIAEYTEVAGCVVRSSEPYSSVVPLQRASILNSVKDLLIPDAQL